MREQVGGEEWGMGHGMGPGYATAHSWCATDDAKRPMGKQGFWSQAAKVLGMGPMFANTYSPLTPIDGTTVPTKPRGPS
eukprot:CAMPEP_0174364526 /NCGR_PEP_ID=MMETSP0811_2-20130205/73286_1 /TAXON_ID=73025 ORGANISM="Eutreptiella gymnastica-like, Strain CCMP1594" /NCGR_SAMPLE_ID=MMETSP0811_2 /ASSEMBLY_ACC=CAM_ASM_000667 /LENGTH=78 /DNA_ID=CAMNT_0015504247 /DNA_START=878 /DNA_END=1114 /DNA_ORIENTATION=+